MKIYKHEYSRGSRTIRTIEYEAEEKQKTYLTIDRQRVSKDKIGKLSGGYFLDMWTLSPDTTEFTNALIEENANRIEKKKRELKEFEEERIRLEAYKKKYTEGWK